MPTGQGSPTKSCASRIKNDIQKMSERPLKFVHAFPDSSNILKWWFLIKGDSDPKSPYKGGYYLGNLLLSPNYPFSAPDYIMLTPSGRFKPGAKICTTISAFHEDTWSAALNVEGVLKSFMSVMTGDHEDGVGHQNISRYWEGNASKAFNERKRLAKESLAYNYRQYPSIMKQFKSFIEEDGDVVAEPTPPPAHKMTDMERAIQESMKDVYPQANIADEDHELAAVLAASMKDAYVTPKHAPNPYGVQFQAGADDDIDDDLAAALAASMNVF